MLNEEIKSVLKQLLQEVQAASANALATAAATNDQKILVQAMACSVIVEKYWEALREMDFDQALSVGRSGVKMLVDEYGPYTTWREETRKVFGYFLAFWYFCQALAHSGMNNPAESRRVASKASEVDECIGALRQAVTISVEQPLDSAGESSPSKASGCLMVVMSLIVAFSPMYLIGNLF